MKLKNLLFAVSASLVLSLTLAGCSDDKPKESAKPAKEAFNPFDHSKDEKISAAEKDEFEAAFIDQCVKKEMYSAPNSDKERFVKPCTCIANEVSKTLTAKEKQKFVDEKENPVSLTFKIDSAGYECLQEKAPPQDSGFIHITPPQ
jgi:hypothetical protein